MKFDKVNVKHFEPITITLENELEYDVMSAIFSETAEQLAHTVTGVSEDEIIEAFNKNDNDTAYIKLASFRSR